MTSSDDMLYCYLLDIVSHLQPLSHRCQLSFNNGNAVPMRSDSFSTMGTAFPRVPPRNDPWCVCVCACVCVCVCMSVCMCLCVCVACCRVTCGSAWRWWTCRWNTSTRKSTTFAANSPKMFSALSLSRFVQNFCWQRKHHVDNWISWYRNVSPFLDFSAVGGDGSLPWCKPEL